jgi:hypothetical protein
VRVVGAGLVLTGVGAGQADGDGRERRLGVPDRELARELAARLRHDGEREDGQRHGRRQVDAGDMSSADARATHVQAPIRAAAAPRTKGCSAADRTVSDRCEVE